MVNAPHILIVDDDRQIRASVARFLAANGFRISAAEDGAAMFAAIEKGRFDLVVLDIMMRGERRINVLSAPSRGKQDPRYFLDRPSEKRNRLRHGAGAGRRRLHLQACPSQGVARANPAVLGRAGHTATFQSKTRAGRQKQFEGWRLDAVRRTLRNPKESAR